MIKLVHACKEIVIHLETKLELVRTPESHSLITKICPTSTVKPNYQKLDQDITEVAFYVPIYLLEFEPTDHYSWCHWTDSLQLLHSICLYRMPYSGNFETVNIIWKLALQK